jgi:hypothetical protein
MGALGILYARDYYPWELRLASRAIIGTKDCYGYATRISS